MYRLYTELHYVVICRQIDKYIDKIFCHLSSVADFQASTAVRNLYSSINFLSAFGWCSFCDVRHQLPPHLHLSLGPWAEHPLLPRLLLRHIPGQANHREGLEHPGAALRCLLHREWCHCYHKQQVRCWPSPTMHCHKYTLRTH